jgi:alkanesulfonate monooxygenase SsuD/methylene tetrahydromethanopterin reductase-like flavin-dependent oxidoreductase (luciferase family)
VRELRFGLHYDFRNPPRWRLPWAEHYRQILEQIRWAEGLGFGSVSISEHHGVDYASSPLTIAAAVAASTRRTWIGTNVLVLPVYHPLRLAEDALTVDALSGGRFRLGVGLGYREPEFRAFGTSLAQRRGRLEEGLEILGRAFGGGRFSFRGRHYSVDDYEVVPGPVRPGGPELWLGGLSEPAIERAARRASGFLSTSLAHLDLYREARRRQGPDAGHAAMLQNWIVDADPERTFARLGEHALHHLREYREFGMAHIPELERAEQLLEIGLYRVLDAAGAVKACLEIVSRGPVELIEILGVLPGERAESSAPRHEYFAREVIPRVREALAARSG